MTARTANPVPRWTPWAGAGLGLVVVVAIGLRFGIGASFVLLAGAALLTVVWMAFRAVQTIVEPTDDDLVAHQDAPTPAQLQKQSALRALRDLEYERSLGNILDDDFKDLERRYREEAKRAMRAVDEERKAMRARAEALVAESLRNAPEPEPEPIAAKKPDTRVVCTECDTHNDPDAKFCKQCGAKMNAEPSKRAAEEVTG